MTPAKLDGDYLYPANPVQKAMFAARGYTAGRFTRSPVRALIDEAIAAGDVVRVIRPTMRDNHDSIGTEEVIIKIPLPALILGGSVEGALRVMEWKDE